MKSDSDNLCYFISFILTYKQASADIQLKTEGVDGSTADECDGAKLNKGPLRLSFRSRRRQVITGVCLALEMYLSTAAYKVNQVCTVPLYI